MLFPPLFQKVNDPRQPNKITYPLPALFFAGILMFMFRLGARRQIGHLLRNGLSNSKFISLFNVPVPHGDTIDESFQRLAPEELQDVICEMVRRLIRKKILYAYRLLDSYYLIAIDGTGIISYSERHCEHCLTKKINGEILYYHTVLEAKLITHAGLVFSIMTEFIENPAPNVTKQDCELKAFYRLAQKLKTQFPFLPICLCLDGLYAGGPTFDLCRKNNWQFIINLTDEDLPTVNQEYSALLPLQSENHLVFKPGNNAKIRQEFLWVNDISYIDSSKKEHSINVFECLETVLKYNGIYEKKKFKWITSFEVTASNVISLANEGGRLRWKIENEGFNVQKNGGYQLEHAYTANFTSAKIFYYLLQIAHMITQLIEYGSLFKKSFPKGVGSSKNLAFRLLEAWRNTVVTKDFLLSVLQQRFQIRFEFNSS